MVEPFSTRGLKALFSYPFRQSGWERKLLILAGLYLASFIVPFIPLVFVTGYVAEIIRRTVSAKGEPELPEWANWSDYLVDGLRLTGVGLLASIPLIVVGVCGFGPYFSSIFAVPILSGFNNDVSGPAALFMMGGFSWLIVSIACSVVFSVLIGIPLPAAAAHVAVQRSFSSVFKVRDWWKIFRANLGGFVIAFFVLWVILVSTGFITQLLVSSIIFCVASFVIPILTAPYICVLMAVLFGQAYREGLETLDLVKNSDAQDAGEEAEGPAI